MIRTALAAFLLCCASASAAGPALEEARWARPGADLFRLLTRSPGECVGRVAPEDAYEVDVGAVAFRSPFLLGGSAARAGLSCNSCHRDGRDNPDFHFDGLSGAPGTADVTSSIFSRKREDGAFNPVAIPDLVGIAGRKSFGTVAPHGALGDFIASAVSDEFDGAAAPVLTQALAAYISRFELRHCPPRGIGATLAGDIALPRKALAAAGEALRRNDAATADFLLLAARGFLGRIDQRFAIDALEQERRALGDLSSLIADIRPLARADAAAAQGAVAAALDRLGETGDFLGAAETKSLYDRETLKRRLDQEKSESP